MHGRRERSKQLTENGTQSTGIGGIDHTPFAIDCELVPVDRSRSIAGMKPTYDAIEASKCTKVRNARLLRIAWLRRCCGRWSMTPQDGPQGNKASRAKHTCPTWRNVHIPGA